MKLSLPNRTLNWPRRPLVMGILNINDDSFSDDGKIDADWATARAVELISQGSDIIDVGAESARTNREAISVDEEVTRLRSFLERWPSILENGTPRDNAQVWPALLSINTWRPEVVEQILPGPVDILNDMSGLPDDRNAKLCAAHEKALLIMHSVGAPKIDHSHVTWKNLPEQMVEFFEEKLTACESAGLHRDQLILDPGLGFAKSPSDDLLILQKLETLHHFQRPILLPVGRKGFIGEVLDQPDAKDRDAGTIAAATAGVSRGASILRVHDVAGTFETVKTLQPLVTSL